MTKKTAHRLDSITTYREVAPTNPKVAYKGPRMVFDHSNLMPILPNRIPGVLYESTNHHPSGVRSQSMSMNLNGKSAHALKKVMVGGCPDQAGRVYESGEVSRPKRTRGVSKPTFGSK